MKKNFKHFFIRLLKDDSEIQELIRNIATPEAQSLSENNAPSIEQTAEKEQPLPVADLLRQQMAAELDLLKQLENDKELRDSWLGTLPATEGEQLRQLIAVAAQWDRILQLWDFLSRRCNQQQRATTREEQTLLAKSVAIHNLIWLDKAACVFSTAIEITFDHQQHERGTPKGDTVIEEWLVGLKNPAGQIQKKPLVKTR